jgi:hypothetical protein
VIDGDANRMQTGVPGANQLGAGGDGDKKENRGRLSSFSASVTSLVNSARGGGQAVNDSTQQDPEKSTSASNAATEPPSPQLRHDSSSKNGSVHSLTGQALSILNYIVDTIDAVTD